MVEMKLAVGSDEKTGLTDFVLEEPRKRGHTDSGKWVRFWCSTI